MGKGQKTMIADGIDNEIQYISNESCCRQFDIITPYFAPYSLSLRCVLHFNEVKMTQRIGPRCRCQQKWNEKKKIGCRKVYARATALCSVVVAFFSRWHLSHWCDCQRNEFFISQSEEEWNEKQMKTKRIMSDTTQRRWRYVDDTTTVSTSTKCEIHQKQRNVKINFYQIQNDTCKWNFSIAAGTGARANPVNESERRRQRRRRNRKKNKLSVGKSHFNFISLWYDIRVRLMWRGQRWETGVASAAIRECVCEFARLCDS